MRERWPGTKNYVLPDLSMNFEQGNPAAMASGKTEGKMVGEASPEMGGMGENKEGDMMGGPMEKGMAMMMTMMMGEAGKEMTQMMQMMQKMMYKYQMEGPMILQGKKEYKFMDFDIENPMTAAEIIQMAGKEACPSNTERETARSCIENLAEEFSSGTEVTCKSPIERAFYKRDMMIDFCKDTYGVHLLT